MLPKLEVYRKYNYPVSFEELSADSKNLISLRCDSGFDTSIVELISRVDVSLSEKVIVKTCLDIISGLDRVNVACLYWDRMLLEMIKSVWQKQGRKKRYVWSGQRLVMKKDIT
jgi:hypothetical protein